MIIEEDGSVLTELMNLIPVEEHPNVLANVKHLQLPSNYMVHEQGKRSTSAYFIESGVARVFYYNQEGKDITDYFGVEGSFISVVETFFNSSEPSNYNIQTLEDSVLISIEWTYFESLLEKYIQLERFGRKLTMKILQEAIERFNAIQFKTAQERYEFMMEKYPNIISRVQSRHVASYLGITPETLSRIRGK